MARIARSGEQRENSRSTRPLWIDIDKISYLADNWSLGGAFLRDVLPDAAVGDKMLARLSLDPISQSPSAYIFVRVLRIGTQGTALRFTELPNNAFDLMSLALYSRRPLLAARQTSATA